MSNIFSNSAISIIKLNQDDSQKLSFIIRNFSILLILFITLFPHTIIAASTLKSASEPDYPPFSFKNNNGDADGMAVELLHAATKVIQRDIQFEVRPWNVIKQELADDQLDVLPLVGRTPEREEIFDFTVPYLSLYGAIVVHNDNDVISNLSDLAGLKVGVMKGDNADEYMRRKGYSDSLITTETYAQALKMLALKKLDAVVIQQFVAQKMIEEHHLTDIKVLHRLMDFRQDFCFAVTKGKSELLAQLNEGLSKVVANGTYHQLKEKWLGMMESDNPESSSFWINLSQNEKQWIKDNPEVTFTGNPNWLPYETFNEQGEYIGVVASYLKLIEKKTGLSFKTNITSNWSESLNLATQGLVSVISSNTTDVILNQTFLPVDSYSQNPIVIIMDIHQNYVENLETIKEQKIAIIKDYGYTADIFKIYPNIHFIEVDNIQQGLEGVSQGQYDAMLATMALASYNIAEMGIHNLKVVGKTPVVMDLTLFVSKQQPILHSILNKTIKSITPAEAHQINAKWNRTNYIEKIDYQLLFQLTAIFMIILTIILFWNKKLNNEIKKRRKIEQELIAKQDIVEEVQALAQTGSWELMSIGSNMHANWSYEIFKIMGIKPTTDVGPELLSTIIHPDDHNAVLLSLQNALNKGSKHDIAYRIIRPDGEMRWVRCSGIPIYDDNEQLIKVRGTFQDITKWIQAKDQIKVQTQALEQSPVSVVITDIQGNIEYVALLRFDE